MSHLTQEIHSSLAISLSDPSASVEKANRRIFESADYSEIPVFNRQELREFLIRMLTVWGTRFAFIRLSVTSRSHRKSPWKICVTDAAGTAEAVVHEIENLDDALIIHPTSLHTVNISCDEQPPEADFMLSITICPRDEQLVAALKDIWPDAPVDVRNSLMGLKLR